MAQDPIRPNSAAASARKALQEAGITLKRAGTDLQQRLERRQQQRAQNQQVNLETILSLALKNCGETACDHPLDADWLDVFLALAEKTSNPEMQQLWALIFAKEASMRVHPHSHIERSTWQYVSRPRAAIGCQPVGLRARSGVLSWQSSVSNKRWQRAVVHVPQHAVPQRSVARVPARSNSLRCPSKTHPPQGQISRTSGGGGVQIRDP